MEEQKKWATYFPRVLFLCHCSLLHFSDWRLRERCLLYESEPWMVSCIQNKTQRCIVPFKPDRIRELAQTLKENPICHAVSSFFWKRNILLNSFCRLMWLKNKKCTMPLSVYNIETPMRKLRMKSKCSRRSGRKYKSTIVRWKEGKMMKKKGKQDKKRKREDWKSWEKRRFGKTKVGCNVQPGFF